MIIVVIIVAIIIIIVKGSSSFSPRALSSQSAFSQIEDKIHHDYDLSCFPSVQFSLIHIHWFFPLGTESPSPSRPYTPPTSPPSSLPCRKKVKTKTCFFFHLLDHISTKNYINRDHRVGQLWPEFLSASSCIYNMSLPQLFRNNLVFFRDKFLSQVVRHFWAVTVFIILVVIDGSCGNTFWLYPLFGFGGRLRSFNHFECGRVFAAHCFHTFPVSSHRQ